MSKRKIKSTEFGKVIAAISLAILIFNNTVQGLTIFGTSLNVVTVNAIAIVSFVGSLFWTISN